MKNTVRRYIDNYLCNTPHAWEVIGDILSKMKNGFYPQDFLDQIVQKWRYDYDIYDAYCFAQINVGVLQGVISRVQIQVASPPFSDKSIQCNNQLLNTLPLPFKGYFLGGTGDNDGQLQWDSCIRVTQHIDKETASQRICFPGSAPLEIGFTEAYTSLLHIRSEHALARLPYDQSYITLFVRTEAGATYS